MCCEMIDRLKAVRDRLLEETDWHRHKAAQVLHRMIATGQYTPGTALPLDEKLVRLVYENHTVSHSWDEVLDIQRRARQLAVDLHANANGRFTLTADFLAAALAGFTGPELHPDRTPIDAARTFLNQRSHDAFREGKSYPLRADWVESLLLAWKLSKTKREREPDILLRQMVDWLREHGYPRAPVPLTVERVARIWESWFGIVVMPDPRKTLAEKTNPRDRMHAYCNLGDWERAILLAGEVERAEGTNLNVLRTQVLCLVRLGRFREALDRAARWQEMATSDARTAAVRRNDMRSLQIEGWIGAHMWPKALGAVRQMIEEMESVSEIGDMRYVLSNAGIVRNKVTPLPHLTVTYAETVEAIAQTLEGMSPGLIAPQVSPICKRALIVGERLRHLFRDGLLVGEPTIPSCICPQENPQDTGESTAPR